MRGGLRACVLGWQSVAARPKEVPTSVLRMLHPPTRCIDIGTAGMTI